MGFEEDKAKLALKKSGNLLIGSAVDQAVEWLDKYADKSVAEITAADATQADDDETNPNVEPAALKPGEVAQSLVCNDCGKKFRSQAQAEFHASKTEHINFAESTEEIAPLTEEEKKTKLEELKRKAAERRAGTSAQDKLEQKRNEEIRRKSTKETQDIKEELKKKEQLKEAAAKKREKQEEIAAKQRIKAKIEADKEERRLKAAKEKAERVGLAAPAGPAPAPLPTTSGPVASKPASAYTETRLRFQTPSGNIQKSFPVETTLFEVASALSQDTGTEVQSFVQNFPKKVFDSVDFGASLKELGLIPSASLIVR
ncbi:MAG: hypothetical protein Q9195_000483 [Heterodermia aff. obscurata]